MASKEYEDRTLEYLERMTNAVEKISETLEEMSTEGVRVTGAGAYISPYDENEEPPEWATEAKEDLPGTIPLPTEKQPDE